MRLGRYREVHRAVLVDGRRLGCDGNLKLARRVFVADGDFGLGLAATALGIGRPDPDRQLPAGIFDRVDLE